MTSGLQEHCMSAYIGVFLQHMKKNAYWQDAALL
jgi:hypothetical protein